MLNTFILSTFCIDNLLTFAKICNKNKKITEKQKAFILSIKSSLILSLFGLFFNYKFLQSNFNGESYLSNFSSNGTNILAQFVILFFTSYLITDIVLGTLFYYKYMLPLSGYTHHFSYIIINIISLYTNSYPIYVLFLFEEIPTTLLSIGSYDSSYRSDLLFGVIFFLTRIIYHLFLLYTFRHNYIVMFFGMLVLPLHLFWFKGWIKKYFLSRIVKKENKSN